MLGRFETQEYVIPIAGRPLRLLGPKYPHALRNEPDVERRFVADGYMPYWTYPTATAVMLAEHLCAHVPPGATPVLELGAGLGVVGLALAMHGGRLIITDYDEEAVEFVRASAALNGLDNVDARLLDWRQPPSEQYDLIIGGDVIYERRSHAPLVALLGQCLTTDGQAYFSDQNRSAAEAFPEAVAAANMRCEVIPVSGPAVPRPDAIDGRTLKGKLYRVTRR